MEEKKVVKITVDGKEINNYVLAIPDKMSTATFIESDNLHFLAELVNENTISEKITKLAKKIIDNENNCNCSSCKNFIEKFNVAINAIMHQDKNKNCDCMACTFKKLMEDIRQSKDNT